MISTLVLRERLRLAAAEDGELSAIKAAVIALFESETLRLWERRVGHVQILRQSPSTRRTLFLELWPVETLTKVEESLDGVTWTDLAVGDYVLARDNRLERVDACWYPWVRVTQTGGYVAEPTGAQQKTPADVVEALLVQADFMHRRNRGPHMDLQSQNFEGGAGVYLKGDQHPYFAQVVAQRKRKV